MAQTTNISVNLGDNNAHSANISGSFNTTVYKSDEDGQIMRWLSPLEPSARHQGVRTGRFSGVGDWLLETREFREWRGGKDGADRAILFCSGNPGVGKTYLSSLVIDNLCDQESEEGIVVAGLYYDFLTQEEQTITNMMGAILKQLIGMGDIPVYLREAFQKRKKEMGGRRLLLADLMGMLRIVIASLPKVFICIDALDECLPKHLPELLELLRDIVRESPRTRVFLTGRPHVTGAVHRYFPKAVRIPISPNTEDIRNYLQMRLDRDDEPEAMDNDLRAEIVEVILEKMSDIFLLVSLNIDAVLGEVTISQRRKKLAEMTRGNGLSDAYTSTLTRLKAQKGNKSTLGLQVLMWVLYSERPLRSEELCHALGVEMGSADLDPGNVPALRTLLTSSLGLVTLEASSSTVQLVHFTLKEHLLSNPTRFHSPHSTMAEVCLTYLNFQCVVDLSPICDSTPSSMPLLEYASCCWGEHAREGMTEDVKILALKLLGRFDKHVSGRLLLMKYQGYEGWGSYIYEWIRSKGFTGLHGAASLGLGEIFAAVLEIKEWDVNATDYTGSTALIWAARRGYEDIVKILLEREDVNPTTADKYGRTPLSLAAEKGHADVVKMLLEREDVNPNTIDKYGRTPLLWAAHGGHSEAVKLLLGREDVDPNTADTEYGRTPLSLAAEKGDAAVVKMLLGREDVNPNMADTGYGRTPLAWAAEKGHEWVVMMLLGREDVNPNTADTGYGRTPLSLAAQGGHSEVVKILLGREDVNPNTADKYGRTPLSLAAEKGHADVVKMLLEREDVNPNTIDKYGRTPLSLAAHGGHSEVVGMLLGREDVNPNMVDTVHGQTPLSLAAKRGHEGVVKLLLERQDVHAATPDHNNQTPLSLALSGGYYGIARILQDYADSDT